MALQTGFLLQKRYKIEGPLGRGGMGAVYKAVDTRLGHVVAIKENFLDEVATGDDTHAAEWNEIRRTQFEREARLLASLKHGGLPKVTDYFFIDGEGQYLVMEYVEGRDFSNVVKELGQVHEDQAVSFMVDICDVVHYLHSQNPPIIHRDIKPANIRITSNGQVVLVDFGVAKVGTSDMTTIGARAVSPGFSPLEQFGGAKPTDERSDIYSLGATLFALVTGKAPTAATERLIEKTDERPETDTAGVSPELKAVLKKSMELRPDDRYQTARDFRVDLQNLVARNAVKKAPYDVHTLVTKVYSPRVNTRATTAGKEPTAAPVRQTTAPPKETAPPPQGAAPPPAPPPPADRPAASVPPSGPPQPATAGQGPTVLATASSSKTPWGIIAGVLVLLAAAVAVFVVDPLGWRAPETTPVVPPTPLIAVHWNDTPSVTENTIELSWSPSATALFAGYEIYYSTEPGFPMADSTRYGRPITNASDTRLLVSGLECGGIYSFRVRVRGSDDEAADSEELTVRTVRCDGVDDGSAGIVDPSQVTGLPAGFEPPAVQVESARPAGADQVEIAWTPVDSRHLQAYEVYYATRAGFSIQSASRYGTPIQSGASTRLTLSGMGCGETYYLKVRALFGDGVASESEEQAVQMAPCATSEPLPAVAMQPLRGVTRSSVEVRWSRSTSEAFRAYEVHYDTSPGFSPSGATRFSGRIQNSRTTSATVTGLDCGTKYYFKVRLLSDDGRSSVSGVKSATTSACRGGGGSTPSTPSTPTDSPSGGRDKPLEAVLASAGRATDSSIDVSWSPTASSSFAAYELHYSTDPGFSPSNATRFGKRLAEPSQTRETLTGLKCGTRYTFLVRSIDAGGRIADSPPITTATIPCVVKDRLVVSPSGGGDYNTVVEALRVLYAASQEDGKNRTIVLKPGRHVMENVVRLADLSIVGEGSAAGIIVESNTSQVFIIEGNNVQLKNLTLKSTASSALNVKGRVVVDGCTITTTAQSAVQVWESGQLTLRNSSITGSGGKGILAWNAARVTVEGGTIQKNESGVEIRDNASITLNGTSVNGNRGSGVYVHDGGRAELSGVRVTGNGRHGISVKRGNVTLNNCTVSQNAQAGLRCSDASNVIKITDSDLTGNAYGIIDCQNVQKVGNVKE